MENVTHNEDTLKKVYSVLVKRGHHTQDEAAELVNAMQSAGILFRERGTDEPIETAQDEKADSVVSAEPKEWIERQDQERRAWAVNTAVEVLRNAVEWDQHLLVNMSKEIETYVKGDNPDLNDVDAQDAFYLIMGQALEEREASVEVDPTEEFLIDCVDRLAKGGVRLKDGSFEGAI